MARERKDQLAARVAADNAAVHTGLRYTDPLFGLITVGRKVDTSPEGWDIYEVEHSGFTHRWGTAIIKP